MISKSKVTQSATKVTDKKKWVISLSYRQLTHIKTDLLQKGLNFSITFKTLMNKDVVATVKDPVKDQALRFKIPRLLRINPPRMSAKL